MFKSFVVVFVVFSLLLVTSGCATIFKGSSDSITFDSNPAGAKVFADGSEVCAATPCETKLKSDKSWKILYTMDGYKDKQVLLENKVGGLWVVLDILAGLLPIIVDAATGTWYEFDQDYMKITLEKK